MLPGHQALGLRPGGGDRDPLDDRRRRPEHLERGPGGRAGGEWKLANHHDVGGTGVDSSGTRFDPARPAWTSPVLDGDLFGEPLVLGATVYVATENDTVYALRAADGTVEWSTHLGTPVPDSSLPCGDITPTVGITGTPVIDAARNELFAVADEDAAGSPSHVLVGLDLTNGAVELHQVVDPPGVDTAALLQRTALTLQGGRVVFGFGGNYGDCSSYHGWVEAVPEGGGSADTFGIDGGAGQREGAVWMGGAAPVVDGSGNIWVAVGNGSEDAAGSPTTTATRLFEALPGPQAAAVLRPGRLGIGERRRPRSRLGGAGAVGRRPGGPGRQISDGLPAPPGPPRRDRRPGG